jgi:hypothetical protein
MDQVLPERVRPGREPGLSQRTPYDPNWSAEVTLIPFADEISEAVEVFAKVRGLEHFHRDLLWVFNECPKGVPGSRIRRLQISAYLQGTQPFLSIVPSVEEMLDSEQILVPRHCTAVRFPANWVLSKGHLDRPKFEARLAEFWENMTSSKLHREEMVPVPVDACIVG